MWHFFAEESQEYQEKEERSYGSIMMERLTGSEDGRIDHVLQVRSFAIRPCNLHFVFPASCSIEGLIFCVWVLSFYMAILLDFSTLSLFSL